MQRENTNRLNNIHIQILISKLLPKSKYMPLLSTIAHTEENGGGGVAANHDCQHGCLENYLGDLQSTLLKVSMVVFPGRVI